MNIVTLIHVLDHLFYPEIALFFMDTNFTEIKAQICVYVVGYNKCVLIGHDWGGMIAWLVAICYPEMVTKLIVVNFPHPSVFTGEFYNSYNVTYVYVLTQTICIFIKIVFALRLLKEEPTTCSFRCSVVKLPELSPPHNLDCILRSSKVLGILLWEIIYCRKWEFLIFFLNPGRFTKT